MSAYWLISGKLTVALGLAFLLLRNAPARWRFRLAMVGLGTVLMPWHRLPVVELGAASRLPAILVQGTPPPNTLDPASVPTTQPSLLLFALALGTVALAFIALRQHTLVRRWHHVARIAPERLRSGGGAPIRVVPASDIAATSGLLRPTIWIGARLLDDPHLPYVLAHEQAHVQQGDHRWVWVITAVRCLLWWHPAAWLWSWVARRELEFSCDERCAERLGADRYRCALAALIRSRLAAPVALLPFIARRSFAMLRLTRLERTPVKTHRHRLALLLTAVLLPLLSLQIVFADDGSPGGTSNVEGEDGEEVRAGEVFSGPETAPSEPAARQLGAAIDVLLDGQTVASLPNLLLTERNWVGVRGAGLRLNVRPTLLIDDQVKLEFSVDLDDAEDEAPLTPILITAFGRMAVMQMGVGADDGSQRTVRIEVTPQRL